VNHVFDRARKWQKKYNDKSTKFRNLIWILLQFFADPDPHGSTFIILPDPDPDRHQKRRKMKKPVNPRQNTKNRPDFSKMLNRT
jgi:hypothetical protein